MNAAGRLPSTICSAGKNRKSKPLPATRSAGSTRGSSTVSASASGSKVPSPETNHSRHATAASGGTHTGCTTAAPPAAGTSGGVCVTGYRSAAMTRNGAGSSKKRRIPARLTLARATDGVQGDVSSPPKMQRSNATPRRCTWMRASASSVAGAMSAPGLVIGVKSQAIIDRG